MQNQIDEIPPECYSHLKHYLLCSLDCDVVANISM